MDAQHPIFLLSPKLHLGPLQPPPLVKHNALVPPLLHIQAKPSSPPPSTTSTSKTEPPAPPPSQPNPPPCLPHTIQAIRDSFYPESQAFMG